MVPVPVLHIKLSSSLYGTLESLESCRLWLLFGGSFQFPFSKSKRWKLTYQYPDFLVWCQCFHAVYIFLTMPDCLGLLWVRKVYNKVAIDCNCISQGVSMVPLSMWQTVKERWRPVIILWCWQWKTERHVEKNWRLSKKFHHLTSRVPPQARWNALCMKKWQLHMSAQVTRHNYASKHSFLRIY